jgi:hypothetical protein
LSLLTSLAPELVIAEDIVELDLDGQPVRDDKRTLYLKRSSPRQSHGSLLTRRWRKWTFHQ